MVTSWSLVILVSAIILLLVTVLLVRWIRQSLQGKKYTRKKRPPYTVSGPGVKSVRYHPPPGILRGLKGEFQGQTFHLQPEGFSLGRSPENDLVISENLVSRYHALIRFEGEGYVLYDRDSTNGTWVNGRRIGRHILRPGDRIQIGLSEFVFYTKGETPSQPAPDESPVPIDETAGEYFEGYYLLEEIGHGGMSRVFKARSPNGEIVALKILQTDDAYIVKKFTQWGNKIAYLLQNHPNIAGIMYFGQSQDGRLYLVEEFVEGTSLRYLVQDIVDSPDKESRIINIIGQVCEALHFAHSRGVIHRDIKPENILVSPEGLVKLTDFGIAKLVSSVTVTSTKIVGTPEYISPEQIAGEANPAGDIYSLGVVLYELLTGRPPFPRPKMKDHIKAMMKVIEMHKKYKPIPPSRLHPVVPPRLEKVAMRALEKNAKNRYRTARDMAIAMGYRASAVTSKPSAFPPGARLVLIEGLRKGREIPLTGTKVVIGRNDLNPQDPYISREHIVIFLRGDQIWLQDTSRNGTWVNGERVYGEHPLKQGDLIYITDNILELQF